MSLTKPGNSFPVVGIGASAGGLDAFKNLLKAIPEDSGMAYVLVQHLHPEHERALTEILLKVTKIPVVEITDDIKVQPNHVYIIPANKMMVANDGVLLLSPRESSKKDSNLVIDLFFTSLAEVHQSHSIGVVLSGTGIDATKGLTAIKKYGGITIAQDTASAAPSGMPQSAIQAGVLDFILAPEMIPQKLLEIALAKRKVEASEQFITLADNIPQLAWMADAEGYIYWYNQRWYDYTGTNLQDMLGWGWQKVHHPDHVDRVVNFVKKAWSINQPFELTFPILGANGEYRWFLTRAQPIAGDNGAILRWFGTNTDITEQREIQSLLEYRKALLEAHNEASIDGILLVDAKGKIISYNKPFTEIWDMPQHIIEAKDDNAALNFAMMQLVNPKQFLDKVLWLYNNPKETSFDELEFINGKLVERQGYSVIAEDGSYYAWSWTFKDITEKRKTEKKIEESEKRFRLLADSVPQHVWTADVNGNLNYYNQSVFDYSGLSLEQLNKDGWLQIVHPDDRDLNMQKWTEAITNGTDFLFEHRFKKYNGEYRWQLSRAVPQKDADGNITMWVGSSTDIQMIKEEEQRKGDFIKMVSHELKTPVTSIKGYVQLLLAMLKEQKDVTLNELPLTPSLERIDKQITRLTRLISEMLDLSRLEESKMDLKMENFVLNDLVTETVQDIKFTNSSHSLIITNNFTGTVYGDKDRLQQVIINLVNNGIKYSPAKTNIEISISNAGDKIAVSVKDSGIGIAKNDTEKIFERFYRVTGKNENSSPGFGIGLFIVNEIIQRHNGEIKVESELNKGSIFTFSLPLNI